MNRLRRRGLTIVELLAVLAIQSVLLGLVVMLIGLLLQADQRGRDELRTGLALDALTSQFRRDVHAAATLEFDEADADDFVSCQFDLTDGRTVVYAARPSALERRELRGDALLARETYRLPPTASLELSQDDSRPATIVCLRLGNPLADATLPVPRWRCEAVLGRDRVGGGTP